jgi:hypothetical protein
MRGKEEAGKEEKTQKLRIGGNGHTSFVLGEALVA